MNTTTGIQEGETVLLGTDHYKCIGGKLVNMSNPDDVREIGEGGLVGMMLERLGHING